MKMHVTNMYYNSTFKLNKYPIPFNFISPLSISSFTPKLQVLSHQDRFTILSPTNT